MLTCTIMHAFEVFTSSCWSLEWPVAVPHLKSLVTCQPSPTTMLVPLYFHQPYAQQPAFSISFPTHHELIWVFYFATFQMLYLVTGCCCIAGDPLTTLQSICRDKNTPMTAFDCTLENTVSNPLSFSSVNIPLQRTAAYIKAQRYDLPCTVNKIKTNLPAKFQRKNINCTI